MVKKVLKPGRLFVGDPSFVMQPLLYSALIDAVEGKSEGAIDIDGSICVVQDIADGTQVQGDDNFVYTTASGLIGLTPGALCEKGKARGSGKWISFNAPVLFQSSSERILITSPGYRLDIVIPQDGAPAPEPAAAAVTARAPRKMKGAPAQDPSKVAIGKCVIGADRRVYRIEKNKNGIKTWKRCSACTEN